VINTTYIRHIPANSGLDIRIYTDIYGYIGISGYVALVAHIILDDLFNWGDDLL